MSAHIEYDTCPGCGAIRNTAGLKRHIKEKHPLLALVKRKVKA